MNIHFLGAAQTVTGSCFVVEACGIRFCVDCGMHQGNAAIEARNVEIQHHRPADIRFILLTHAHIDHSGLLPRMVREGFGGPVYCTPPTAALVSLMLEDSAHIQETEAEWKRKKYNRRLGQGGAVRNIEPLYTTEDARRVPEHLSAVEYGQPFQPAPGIEVVYRDAGHILGSALLELRITEHGKTTRLLFSGDLGRPGTLLMHDPVTPSPVDYLFIESTYGDRNHRNEADTLEELAEAIAYSYSRHDKVIIPAFAVGRTQEILYCLYLLHRTGKLPDDMPIFVDSPLAIRVTEVFRKFAGYLDTREADVLGHADAYLPQLRFTLNAAESQSLNTLPGPAIIISASGMCNAGRVKHHLRHNAWRPGASIVFVGYQGVGTPGRKIVDGAASIRLFNEDVAIKARVFTIGGFSAHAGQSQLLEWIDGMRRPGMQVVLVHGEEKAQQTLAGLIEERFGLQVSIPSYLESMTLEPGASPHRLVAAKDGQDSVNWIGLLEETAAGLDQLKSRLDDAAGLPWEEQMDIRDRILDLNKEFASVLAQLQSVSPTK